MRSAPRGPSPRRHGRMTSGSKGARVRAVTPPSIWTALLTLGATVARDGCGGAAAGTRDGGVGPLSRRPHRARGDGHHDAGGGVAGSGGSTGGRVAHQGRVG